MSPGRVLQLELWGFALALLAVVVIKILTASINLRGLLAAKDSSTNVSPERVQLLVLTLAASIGYINQAARVQGARLPDVGSSWLYIYGGSSTIYAAAKLWRIWSSGRK